MQLNSRRNTESLVEVRVRTATPQAIHRHKRSRVVEKILIVALLAFGFSSGFQLWWTLRAQADGVSGLINAPSDQLKNLGQAEGPNAKLKSTPDPCLAKVPTPQIKDGLHRVIQLVNCSKATLLGTANAAQQQFKNPLPVLPREGTWEMKPVGSAGNENVLTIDIPLGWENTKCPEGQKNCEGIVGPRIWARTGCRIDVAFDKAQCETGGCGGRYDCSAARLAASVGTTIAEWTLAEPVQNSTVPPIKYLKDSPDISAVDGENLNMDIQPLGATPRNP